MDETTEYVGLFGYNNGILKNIVMDKCSVSNGKYTGILVGKNGSTNSYTHYIENINVLNCTVLGSDYTGAISGMNIGGSIKNIRINDCNISGTTNVKFAGGIIGYILAGGTVETLENCYNSGSVFSSLDKSVETGAIVGAACSSKMTFTIKNCYSSDSKYNNKICNGNVKNNKCTPSYKGYCDTIDG